MQATRRSQCEARVVGDEAKRPRLRQSKRLFARPQRFLERARPDMQHACGIEAELGGAGRIKSAVFAAHNLRRDNQRGALGDARAEPRHREPERRYAVACRDGGDFGHGPGGGILKRIRKRFETTSGPQGGGAQGRGGRGGGEMYLHRNKLEQKRNMRNRPSAARA